MTARALAGLRLLLDGKVQVIGGDSEYSMEVFDPQIDEFNALALASMDAQYGAFDEGSSVR
jgi:hypothetical protein